MYKNFNLTESEKEQILKQHKKHGYGKTLNEQYEDESMGDDTNDGSEQGMGSTKLQLQPDVYVDVHIFTMFVSDESNAEAYVKIEINQEGSIVRMAVTQNETSHSDDKIKSFVIENIPNGSFQEFPTILSYNFEDKSTDAHF
jgi:hypothetical protein